MSKMLATVSVAALTLSAGFLGLAYAIGGDSVFHDPQSLKGIKPLIDLATHREWRWSGGDSLSVDAPVNLRYQPHGKPGVSVTGPAGEVAQVKFGDGRIASDAPAPKKSDKKIQAVVSGVPIRKFVVNGRETLELGHVDQDSLDIHVNGRGKVSGDGKVADLNLVLSGAGDADLGKLTADAAKVTILGSGTVRLAPRLSLEVFIAGSGRLLLASRPKSIRQTIVGSGEIEPEPEPHSVPAPAPEPQPLPQRVPVPPQPPQPPTGDGATRRNAVVVNGSHDVDMGQLDQDVLTLTIAGPGSVTAAGRVKRLMLTVTGSGKANLGSLAVEDAKVMVTGSGGATIAPSGDLQVTITGSGDVRLITHPATIRRAIYGSGKVIAPDR